LAFLISLKKMSFSTGSKDSTPEPALHARASRANKTLKLPLMLGTIGILFGRSNKF
jgi:hypothetical protein